MGLDFDVEAFLDGLGNTKPPYDCPVKNCYRIYRTFHGFRNHLFKFDHDNPPPETPVSGSRRSRKYRKLSKSRKSSPEPINLPMRETLTHAEAQKIVEFEVQGRIYRQSIYEPLEILPVDKTAAKLSPENLNSSIQALSKRPASQEPEVAKKKIKLPEAQFRVIDDYKLPDGPPQSEEYIQFVEKSIEEMDKEVEYEMDEADMAWLQIMNERRDKLSLPHVSMDDFEVMMDRLEKESYLQMQNSGKDSAESIDEEAICCICMDGDCENSNQILFCDMCNLAVHQECYGVPFIPEGQWLCRRCLQCPTQAVDCALCPNKGGAFKQTIDSRWAHVVCAIWIPEVCFANTVFLEPIDNIENIAKGRLNLTCYICKIKGEGACIQCNKSSCYTAFHVTCAQQADLSMKMAIVRDQNMDGSSVNVKKAAYCDVHTPADSDTQPQVNKVKERMRAQKRERMKKARKSLAENNDSSAPVLAIPTIPAERLQAISAMVNFPKKNPFLMRLMAYWTLKRQSRNGVPLLRRLQVSQQSRRGQNKDKEEDALVSQCKYLQRIRQDLEKARLLCELTKKREKAKKELNRIREKEILLRLFPWMEFLQRAIDLLQDLDVHKVFAKPVSPRDAFDYYDVILNPMDFSKIREKAKTFQYSSFESLQKDYDLMISNCLAYNQKRTFYHKWALKMKDRGQAVFRQIEREMNDIGFDFQSLCLRKEKPGKDKPKLNVCQLADKEAKEETSVSDKPVVVEVVGKRMLPSSRKRSVDKESYKGEIVGSCNGRPRVNSPVQSKKRVRTTSGERASVYSDNDTSSPSEVSNEQRAHQQTGETAARRERQSNPTVSREFSSNLDGIKYNHVIDHRQSTRTP